MPSPNDARIIVVKAQAWFAIIRTPRPRIAKPECWQDFQRGQFVAVIGHANANQNIFRRSFCIFNRHIEITVVVKNSRFEQPVFRFLARALVIFFN